MKERTKRLQALFCALAVTATSVGSPLVSVPVYAEDTQGAEDTSEQPETESGKQQMHQTTRYQKVRIRQRNQWN